MKVPFLQVNTPRNALQSTAMALGGGLLLLAAFNLSRIGHDAPSLDWTALIGAIGTAWIGTILCLSVSPRFSDVFVQRAAALLAVIAGAYTCFPHLT